MVCTRPIDAFRAPNGQIVFAKKHGFSDLPLKIPCGQCLGCRLERSRQWAMRITHESSMWPQNLFLTLTYSDEELPPDGTLVPGHHQNFMKRLRKKYAGRTIRYYHVGEYGSETKRPHYHTIVFNLDFADKILLGRSARDEPLYKSAELDGLWGHGNCVIGNVSWESAAYCARYVVDKLTGSRKSEYGSRIPEYSTMSRRPGIGSTWFSQWKSDVFPLDGCVLNGKKLRVPRAYDRLLVPSTPSSLGFVEIDRIKGKRKRKAIKNSENQTRERLDVIEELNQLRVERLKRTV